MPNIPTDWGRFVSRWGYKDELEMFTDLYINEGLSYSQLADRFDVSIGTIVVRMKFLGIQARPRGGPRNPGYCRRKLWFLDQRMVFGLPLKRLAEYARVSNSVIYKYRKTVGKGFDAVCYNNPNSGSLTLRNLLKNASRAVPHNEPAIPRVLPGEGEEG